MTFWGDIQKCCMLCVYESYNRIWICLGLFVHSDVLSVSNRLLSHFSHFHRIDEIGNLEIINHIKKQFNIVTVCLLQNNTEHLNTYVLYKLKWHD